RPNSALAGGCLSACATGCLVGHAKGGSPNALPKQPLVIPRSGEPAGGHPDGGGTPPRSGTESARRSCGSSCVEREGEMGKKLKRGSAVIALALALAAFAAGPAAAKPGHVKGNHASWGEASWFEEPAGTV